MNKYLLYTITCLLFLIVACKEEDDVASPNLPSSEKEFLTFSFLAKNNPKYLQEDFSFVASGDHINAMFPPGQQVDSLIASFTSNTDSVMVDSVAQKSDTTMNDYTKPVTYTLVAEDSSVHHYRVDIHQYTGLPIIYINTNDSIPITSKNNYIDATITLIANGNGVEEITNMDVEIKGRGNTTWQMPKKPYKMKFGNKTGMLEMPAEKSWVLLANYADKTLMRNRLTFELSKRFGLAYTPQSRFVEVYLNGRYDGNYLLTEEIDIDENRLNIEKLKEDDISGDAISGGYLLEVDIRKDADFWFVTDQKVPIAIKAPEDIASEQMEYIQQYVQTTETVLFSENFADPAEGYAKYIDVESFINWYLVNEIAKNTDAKFVSSVYMYKPRNGKLMMGPVWDYDIALGNVNYSQGKFPEGWYIREASWIKRLFQDPAFSQRVKNRWNELKVSELKAIVDEIDKTATYLETSQTQNFNRWKILNKSTWPNPVVTGSYEGEIEYMKKWLTTRIEWMDQAINQ